MALEVLPEKSEESLGIVKQDVLPYTDPSTQVPAVQYERLKDAVIANAHAIGLADGTTSGSLEARVAALSAELARIRVCGALSQSGSAERTVGMFRLDAGQVFDAVAVIGTAGSGHTATLRLRRFAGGGEACSWERTGTPAEVTLTSPLTVAASDWYELTIAAADEGQVAHFFGFDGQLS